MNKDEEFEDEFEDDDEFIDDGTIDWDDPLGIKAAMNQPFYEKAIQVKDLLHGCKNLEEGQENSKTFSKMFNPIVQNSMILNIIIGQSYAFKLYDEKMTAMARAREHCVWLSKAINDYFEYLPKTDINQKMYRLVHEEMHDFQLAFIAEVNSYKTCDYVPDPWGVFNPPGVDSADFYS
ncbi:MAG: hypothetical protein KDC83_12120 [Flavobacteriales bacterium]|nr:hypothetical protein [Flavobacteriales bacterium]